ncbi:MULTISPECIES: prepilin-type N-terminal cleavage/methylation domain-containing protein [Klebsiella]|uniref:prepilin-type N-terminal cleavage/methylation domain-containing protein n=1 Tax=Klebsiella TaxID=570 RepID=UPI0005EED55E|nr:MULTISPECIES: prepilin-type N-terminal cleavage/methylation domain-containing protein [Klebsiella]EIW9477416.1 prepilin-type N-terminal cleavage/methylation domain-containing protein [Klebsiella aerogenes]EIW9497619.1 prepilin-type N-terminal cleavage/methylation domain-containing protein [Klebsiella aerogenes]EKM7514616.1 prepilin-type N-terminal cleavage/methylation domain-containing protein [Klebsiella aerogenes]EKU6609211.1 prepilin-type N-terminal cleavage/methylation domain-containing 
MPDAVARQRGFSLAETLLAMALLIMTITALGGYHRGLASGAAQLNAYRQQWRDAWRLSLLVPSAQPYKGQISRVQTSRQSCVSITVTITMPAAKRVQMTRLHCPVNQ